MSAAVEFEGQESRELTSRPPIPAEFYKKSTPWAIAYLFYAAGLFGIPAFLSYVVATRVESLVLQILLIAPLTVLAGFGLQNMGFVGHEGLHFSLFRRKLVSASVGIVWASSVVTYFEIAFAMQHWNHHRFTNQAADPDVGMVSRYRYWWQRILFTRLTYNLHYMRVLVDMLRGRPWPYRYKLPLPLATVRKLCWFNLGCAIAWIGLYGWIAVRWPVAGLVSVALPMLAATLISGMQPYLDHGGTSDEPLRNAWSRTSPLMTALYFGSNHHLEHHLYPGVPGYKLPAVHRYLVQKGVLDRAGSPVQPSFLRSYGRLASPYETSERISDFDPFVPADAA